MRTCRQDLASANGLIVTCKPACDIVVVFDGAQTPFVLRKAEQTQIVEETDVSNISTEPWKEQKWKVVGECYVHGLMDNEILNSKFAEQRQTFFWIT